MGRSPCCSKQGLNRGAWTALEDKILTAYIKAHGEGKWRNLPNRAGLKRCGKSCRFRWLNYLRPDIKRGNISHDEEELIIRLHKLLGNRWSLITGRLPGRTDNEIKNYWNTTLAKKANAQSSPQKYDKNLPRKSKFEKLADIGPNTTTNPSTSVQHTTQVISTKATRCTKVLVHFSPLGQQHEINTNISKYIDPLSQTSLINPQPQELPINQQSNSLDLDYKVDFPEVPHGSFEEPMFKDWSTNMSLEDNSNLDLEALGFLLDSEDWP